jgi:hypothetical protein
MASGGVTRTSVEESDIDSILLKLSLLLRHQVKQMITPHLLKMLAMAIGVINTLQLGQMYFLNLLQI